MRRSGREFTFISLRLPHLSFAFLRQAPQRKKKAEKRSSPLPETSESVPPESPAGAGQEGFSAALKQAKKNPHRRNS
jgi:hypothetical protein